MFESTTEDREAGRSRAARQSILKLKLENLRPDELYSTLNSKAVRGSRISFATNVTKDAIEGNPAANRGSAGDGETPPRQPELASEPASRRDRPGQYKFALKKTQIHESKTYTWADKFEIEDDKSKFRRGKNEFWDGRSKIRRDKFAIEDDQSKFHCGKNEIAAGKNGNPRGDRPLRESARD